jgi:prephenate dehydrogenase
MSDLPPQPFRRIGLVGFGLMGGSLARALKALSDPPHVRATAANPRDLEEGLAAGVLDEAVTHIPDLLKDLDLLVYATPLGSTLDLMREFAALLEPQTLVTDLVSLKVPVLERMKDLDLTHRFVGSHPMTGGEGMGFSASRDGLFEGVRVWMVAEGVDRESLGKVEGFWLAVGARPALLDAGKHDEMMAWVSHLPQLVANSLAMALEDAGLTAGEVGPGGRDMIRLARSAPEMWEDLLRAAPKGLSRALETVEKCLCEFRTLLDQGKAEEIAVRMHRTRRWLEEGKWS